MHVLVGIKSCKNLREIDVVIRSELKIFELFSKIFTLRKEIFLTNILLDVEITQNQKEKKN